MNAIAGTGSSLPGAPVIGGRASETTTGGGDLLAAMNPAMDAAFAIGRPVDSRGAAAILGTAGAYISGAQATLARVDDGIEQRRAQLDRLRHDDPDAARRLEQQIDLLQRLRDRIQLSIERVSETIAGSDDEDPSDAVDTTASRQVRTRDEDLELLEQRRRLLAGSASASIAPIDPDQVADTYGAQRAAGAGEAAA